MLGNFWTLQNQFCFNGSKPLGLAKILLELHNSGTVQILSQREDLGFEYDKLIPHLFEGNLPIELSRNLSEGEKHLLNEIPMKTNRSVWQNLKSYFFKSKGNKLISESYL